MLTESFSASFLEQIKNAKHIVFSDFDGTITLQDSNDYLTDNYGMGLAQRQILNDLILRGELSFRDGFQQMLESVLPQFHKCIEILNKNIELDSGFKNFYDYCVANGILIIIVSSGMKPIIKDLLNLLLPENNLEIISNDVDIQENPAVNTEKNWNIIYRDSTPFGHDKSIAIKQIIQIKKQHDSAGSCHYFYCGDGVSDLSAAKETELLFAKKGKDLIKFCKAQGIPYSVFASFSDILDVVQSVVTGKHTIEYFFEE